MYRKILEWMSELGIEFALLIAGMVGGFASLKSKKGLSFWEKVSTIFIGGGVAVYVTPIVVNIANFNLQTSYGVGFVVGYGGLKTVEWVLLLIKDKILK